jgi:LacI family transcriptional regulator
MEKVPTIKDVASLAQVHAATASRALNPQTRNKVNPTTATRILEAAKALGYAPNSAARSLRTRTSLVAGVIIPDLRNPVFPPIVRGIEDGLRDAGYMALLGNTDGDADRERELLAAMRGRQTDGFILATSRRDLPPETDGGRVVPTVLVNRRTDNPNVAAVTADSHAGIVAVVRLLAGLGHRRIAHLAGPQDLSTGWERHRAFLTAMADEALDPTLVRYCAGFTEESGHRAARDLFAAETGITAVIAGNDLIALGAYVALAERGLTCPTDVSVVGFNDMPFVDKQRPALTTVRIPHYDLGIGAARLLLERIANPAAPARQVVLPIHLVQRESVAPPRHG